MSRQRRSSEIQFGSDSFLDVVANIVGILIILIVIAGLRVSKIPYVASRADLDLKTPELMPEKDVLNSNRLATPALPDDDESSPDIALQAPEQPAETPVVERPPLPEPVIPNELLELTEKLQAEIASLTAEDAKLAARMKKSSQQQSGFRECQKAIREKLAESLVELDESRKQSLKAQGDLEIARESLVRLAKEFEELKAMPTHVETIEHKLTPVSRVVNGNEKHYRLERNRVIEVPLDELTSRLKEQIDRRKDWLIKTRQHQGKIGPIRGFQMQYLVRVEPLSPLDDLKSGHGGFRISLAQWEIIPEQDAKGESEAEALRKGSQFYLSLLGANSDTTLTFWVYPDSYAIYRKLQKFSHDHGFSVAGRPLPNGVQIAGSPNGSKSAGQ